MIEPIYLSHLHEESPVFIPKYIASFLANYHIIGVRFLYDAFIKKRKGAIMNIESDMNIPLLVSSFLSALLSPNEDRTTIIISHPDNTLKWMYHLKKHAGIDTILLTNPEDFQLTGCKIILVPRENVDLLKTCPYKQIFCVVVEEFDSMANKLLLRKIRGEFNIGITHKNFLLNQDSKVQYNMLHCINPDKYKKRLNFYKEHSEHYINFRDAYNEDWLRLTWNFCKSFKKSSEEEKNGYLKTLSEWAEANGINYKPGLHKKPKRLGTTRKNPSKIKLQDDDPDDLETRNVKTPKLSFNTSNPILNEIKSEAIPECDKTFFPEKENSQDTIQLLTQNEDSNTATSSNQPLLNEDNFYNSFILSHKSQTESPENKYKNYLNSLINDDINSYDSLLDKSINVDAEIKEKYLSSLLGND